MSQYKRQDQGGSRVYTIRPAGPYDLDHVVEHNAQMARETEGRVLNRATLQEGVRRCLADADKGRYYVAEWGPACVGQLLITREWSDWRNGWFWWIQSVFVVPEHRRQGVFRMLFERVTADARSAGNVCGIRLYVERENSAAISTYRKLGMVETAYRLLEVDWST